MKKNWIVAIFLKTENLASIFGKIPKVWVWFQLDCVGNEFRLMIQVFKKI